MILDIYSLEHSYEHFHLAMLNENYSYKVQNEN